MYKHGGTPPWRGAALTLAAVGNPVVIWGYFVGRHQLGFVGCKPSFFFKCGALSYSVKRAMLGDPMGFLHTTKGTYRPTYLGYGRLALVDNLF